MKNLGIKAASLALMLALFTVTANAQPQGGHGGHGGQRGGAQQREKQTPEKIAEIRTDKMDQELELTDAQEKKIYAINLKYAQEMEKQMEALKKQREAKGDKPAERPSREAMEEQKKQREAKKEALNLAIMSELNDSQKLKYAMSVARAEAKMQMRKQGQKGSGNQQGQKGPGNQQGQKGPNNQQGPKKPQVNCAE